VFAGSSSGQAFARSRLKEAQSHSGAGGFDVRVATVTLLSIGLVLLSLGTLAPVASAEKKYCIEGDGVCPGGELVCVIHANQFVACVPDPCDTTACF
jgi:hypothetical protein